MSEFVKINETISPHSHDVLQIVRDAKHDGIVVRLHDCIGVFLACRRKKHESSKYSANKSRELKFLETLFTKV